MPSNVTSPLAVQTRGAGAPIVCLHSSAGSGGQWRYLAETLSQRWRVLLPELHGHGDSPAWPAVQMNTLDVDASAVADIAGASPVHLVGHSYGAAVALQMALRHPERVRSLTLYEPVVFGMLRAETADHAVLEEIEDVASSVARLVAGGAVQDAARVFVGYWGGSHAWTQLSESQRRALMSRMAVVPKHFESLFAARWSPELLARLQMPVLLLRGSGTRAPARRVTELLAQALPHAQCGVLPQAGHLGPITHAQTVGHWMTAHIDPLLAHRFDTPRALSLA